MDGTSDDDIPVLTHVLRTGDGRMPRSLMTPADDDSYVDEFGIHHFEEAPVTRQIVIGHEALDDLMAPTVNGNFARPRSSPVADPRQTHRDPFRLAQDIDGAHPHVDPIDHPHLISDPGAHASASPPPLLDQPLDFAAPSKTVAPIDNAVMAARLRDSIFTDLASRIDMELDARIAQVLHAEIESALAQLQANLRSHLTEALRDVVARAVGEELARMNQQSGDRPH